MPGVGVSEWVETEGDEWGPLEFREEPRSEEQLFVNRVRVGTTRSEQHEAIWVTKDWLNGSPQPRQPGPTPLRVLRALLRAHDLRAKAPGTECSNWRICKGADWCPDCHGSGRNLTPNELARWKERTRE